MSTGLDSLDTSLQKTNEYFIRIEERLNWHGRRDQTYLAVRTIIHRLRDHLPLHEMTHIASQMPIILKGIYYDGWKPREKPIRESAEHFIDATQQQFQYSVEDINFVIKVVLQETLGMLSEGEQEKILSILPKDIAGLICDED